MENLHLDENQDFERKNFYVSKNWRTSFIEEIVKLAGGQARKSNWYLLALNELFERKFIELGSKTKLKAIICHFGVCLTNGEYYGDDLAKKLRSNKKLILPLAQAKSDKWPLVKYCLVQVF